MTISPSAGPTRLLVLLVLLAVPLFSLTNRVLTPNGDGRNDSVSFTFDNPEDSEISGKIYTLRGAFVAEIPAASSQNTFRWNGRSEGVPVPTGVYIYRFVCGTRVFTGTLVVIR